MPHRLAKLVQTLRNRRKLFPFSPFNLVHAYAHIFKQTQSPARKMTTAGAGSEAKSIAVMQSTLAINQKLLTAPHAKQPNIDAPINILRPKLQVAHKKMSAIWHYVGLLFKEKTGEDFIRHAAPNILFTRRGQEPIRNGLPTRMPLDALKENLTHQWINSYQSHNQPSFGYGTCASFNDLKSAFSENDQDMMSRYLVVLFHQHAVHLPSFKALNGGEENERDYENEYLAIGEIKQSQILVQISPQYQEDFNLGLSVPNEACEHSEHVLPATVSQDDLRSHAAIFLWLLENNCEEAALLMAREVYPNHSKERIITRLQLQQGMEKPIAESAFDKVADFIFEQVNTPRAETVSTKPS